MITINQNYRDTTVIIAGVFNNIAILEPQTNYKPVYPLSFKDIKLNKLGFINVKEYMLDQLKQFSLQLYKAYISKEITEQQYDIVDTHLTNSIYQKYVQESKKKY